MGNDIKNIGDTIGKKLQQYDTPHHNTQSGIPTSIQQNMRDTAYLNNLLEKSIINLGCKLQFDVNSLSKNGQKWENSLMRGKVTIQSSESRDHKYTQQCHSKISVQKEQDLQQKKQEENKKNEQQKISHSKNSQMQHNQKDLGLQKQNQNIRLQKKHKKSKKIEYNIIMTLAQIYQLKRLLQNYQQQQTQIQKKRRQSQGKLCVICLDNKPQQVLPCAHSYCKSCMATYVIGKDKKCPMCRKSYKESLIENIYQIIEWDEDFVVEMRCIFFKILQKHNPRQVRKIKHHLQATPTGNQQKKIQNIQNE